jgi:hypothetical protein
MPRIGFVLCLALVLLAASPSGAAPFRYPEGRHGKGELKYINGLPVLIVEGTPEEIGKQMGKLAAAPAAALVGTLQRYVKEQGLDAVLPLLTRAGRGLFKRFPEAYRKEAEAMARASGIDLDLIILANTITDLEKIAGCSALTVSAARSATGAPLVGRNWDFHPLGNLHEYSLVVVHKAAGKRAFALVTFPGLLMGGSAINDAGLVLASNEITEARDGSAKLNPRGVSTAVGLRRLIEEHDSVAGVEKFLRSVHPTCMCSLIVADAKGDAAVFEITTKSLEVRRPEHGLCVCTNHFCSKALAISTACPRFDALSKAQDQPKLSLSDVARKMHEAHQGAATMQTMVFEPATRKLHLSLGKGPASARPLKLLDLAALLGRKKGE